MSANDLTTIIVAFIGFAGVIGAALISSRLTSNRIAQNPNSRLRIILPGQLTTSKKAKRNWIFWGIGFGVISILLIANWLYPNWQTLDSGHYHLGDNFFRMDQAQRPRYSEPMGDIVDRLILWDKDSHEFYSNSAYSIDLQHTDWEQLEFERYGEVFGGNYYLGRVVIGYTYTFSFQDLLRNSRGLFKPEIMRLKFDVFDLSIEQAPGGLYVTLNDNTFRTRVVADFQVERYNWTSIDPIAIPVSLMSAGVNSLHIVVSPKYAHHEGIKYFHFEDVEIANVQVRLD